MSLPLDEFIKRLTSCGLMSVDELASFQSELPQPPQTVDDLSRMLFENERLTKFQIGVLQGDDGPPLVLGHYELQDTIGAGGMGQVYLARHRRMKRDVALKVLRSTINQQPQAIRRFEREVEAVAQLSHPNIVVAYDAGDEQGVYFYVMEYVAGRNLASIVKTSSPVDVTDAVDWTLQAARGLEYAHSRNVIHRDIKPSNLLLDNDGVVKVLDLGLARIDEAETETEPAQDGLTSTGTVMGTADFMAPEQALNAKNADHRSDIYSLGCSLFYLLAGRPIYQGQSVIEKILAHRDEPIPSLVALRADVPRSLDGVFVKMVAKKPDERYQSMSDVIAALDGCGLVKNTSATQDEASSTSKGATQVAAQGSTDLAVPTVTYVETDDEAVVSQETHIATVEQPTVISDDEAIETTVIRKRRRTFVVAGVLLAVGLLIAIGAALWPPQTASKNPIEPAADSTAAGPSTRKSRADVPGLLLETQHHPHHGDWNLIPANARGMVRGWDFSPDGSEIAVRCGRIFSLYDTETLQSTRFILHEPGIIDYRHWRRPQTDLWPKRTEAWVSIKQSLHSPAIIEAIDLALSLGSLRKPSRDGQWFAFTRDAGTIEVVQEKGGRPRLLTGHPSGVTAMSWNPTSTVLASSGQDGNVSLWPIGSGDRETTLATELTGINGIVWSPDGQRVVLKTGDGRFAVWSRSGAQSETQQSPEGEILFVEWSPNGKWFVTQSVNRVLRLWDAVGVEQAMVAPSTPGLGLHRAPIVAWKPDSTEIAFCRTDTHAIDIRNVAGTETRSLALASETSPVDVKWTPSSNRLIVQVRVESPRSELNDVPKRGEQFVLLDAEPTDQAGLAKGPLISSTFGYHRQICFSPDSTRLVVSTGRQITVLQRDGRIDSKLIMSQVERRRVEWPSDQSIYYHDRPTQTVIRWTPAEKQSNKVPGIVEPSARWSVNPKRSLHAIVTPAGRIILRNEDGTETTSPAAHIGVAEVAWRPDGTRFASVGRDGWLKVWDLEGQLIASKLASNANLRFVAWHPTQNLLAAEGSDQDVYWWDIADNSLTKRTSGIVFGGDERLAWSPDGRWLAMQDAHRIQLFETDSSAGPVVASTMTKLQGLTWSPDGKTLAAIEASGTVSLWNTDNWSLDRCVLLLGGDQAIAVAGDGTILHGDAGVIENELRYVVLTPDGKHVLLKPSEFGAALPAGPR